METWVIILIVILVIMIIGVIIFLIWYFASHGGKLGGTCADQGHCSSGYVCTNTGTVAAPTYTCQAGYRTPCTGGATGKDCAAGLTCNSSGICVPLPAVTIPVTPAITASNLRTRNLARGRTTGSNRRTFDAATVRAPDHPLLSESHDHRSSGSPTAGLRLRNPRPASQAPMYRGDHRGPLTAPVSNTISLDHTVPSDYSENSENVDDSANSYDNSALSSSASAISVDPGHTRGQESASASNYCIDLCSYSQLNIELYDKGDIIVRNNNNQARAVTSNARLIQIFSYQRYLTGLTTSGTIVWLKSEYVGQSHWIWEQYPSLPQQITSCSATLDQNHIWLFNARAQHGYLFRGTELVEDVVRCDKRRVYGKDHSIYLEIDDHTRVATVQPSKQQFTDVVDAVISYNQTVSLLTTPQLANYRGITLVNWEPQYIRV
jgi:hypothetical protein